jgi:hypothetical protein
MPALPAVNQVIRTALVGQQGLDADVVTRFYHSYTGTAPTDAQLVTFATTIGTAWNTDLASLHGMQYTLNQVECIDLSSATSAIGTAAVSHTGTRSGAKLPGSACMVTSYTIARRYRGGHPRGYWSMGTDAEIADQQHWTSAFVTAVDTGVTAFFAAIAAGGWTGAGTIQQVNVSYYHNFTVVTNPITGRARNVPTLRGTPLQDAVTAYVARSSIGSQRRRNQFAL